MQNACRNRGEYFGSHTANANQTLDSLRRFHRRVVRLPFSDSDDEARSAHVSSLVFVAFAAAAIYAITVGFVMRKKLFAQSAKALPADPQKAFSRWRAANIIGFTCAMNPTIFGVALKFIGASWLMPGILFAVGLGFLVLWRPRSDSSPFLKRDAV